MTDDINIHVDVEGAEKGKRDLDGVAKSAKGVGDKTAAGGKRGADGLDGMSQSAVKAQGRFAKLMSSVTGWVAGLASIAVVIRSITAAIRIQKQAIEEHARVAAAQQQKMLRLQYLGGLFRERPDLRSEVESLAESGRRPFEEVADAWYNLRSKGGALTTGQKDAIMREALEMGRTDPGLPLDTLVDMFSLYTKKTGQTDINRVQNVLQQTITEAGGSGADVARYMPEFLPIGMSGGLTGAQAAGLWSFATTQTASANIATTGLRALFMGLQGRGSPEGQKLLKGMGIAPETDFFTKISQLSAARSAGKFGLGQAELIAGREGASVLLDILNNPAAMFQTIASVTGADTGDIDITRSMIDELMGADELARTEEEIRRKGVAIQNIKGADLNALRWEDRKKLIELNMRKMGYSDVAISMMLWGESTKAAFGLAPGEFEQSLSFIHQPSGGGVTIINDSSMHFTPVVGADQFKTGERVSTLDVQ